MRYSENLSHTIHRNRVYGDFAVGQNRRTCERISTRELDRRNLAGRPASLDCEALYFHSLRAMSLQRPKNRITKIANDLSLGVLVLLVVVLIAWIFGLRLTESALSSWGQWFGAFVAGVAMVATAYAIILQARHGESASWSIALSRLGELYDKAQEDERLSRLLLEPADTDGVEMLDPDDLDLTPQQTIWLASLFLAFEQIYVATNSLSSESQRVWRLYLRNQVNKPTFRAAFVRDSTNARDYHQHFWRFVRGTPLPSSSATGAIGYANYAIHPKFFEAQDGKRVAPVATHAPCIARKLEAADLGFWLELYRDPDVRRQMYAAPTESEDALNAYLAPRNIFTVWQDDQRVGGFTITPEKDRMATFGILVHPKHRGRGFSNQILRLLESEANHRGFLTLRADVYAENEPCLAALRRAGYRRFIWLEKNIT